MNDNNFCLAYCVDNQDIAQHIHNHLSRVGYEIEHVMMGNGKEETFLQDRLASVSKRIFIIISGNFLKNMNCMNRGLFMIQELVMQKGAVPIITDEKILNPETQKIEFVPTEFERMSQIIKYMNYWQDMYLDMRKERRNISEDKLETFDSDLKMVRAVSAEMNEFLRVLKNNFHWDFETMNGDAYANFFNSFDQPGLHDALKNAIANGEIPKVIVQPPVQIAAAPKVENENPEELKNPFLEEEKMETEEVESVEIIEEATTENPTDNISQKEISTPQEELNVEDEDSLVNEKIKEGEPVTSKTSTLIDNEDLLKISEDNIRKKGKVPLLDKLIRHRQSDIQSQKVIAETQTSDTDEVFESAVERAVEEEKKDSKIPSILSQPAEDLKAILNNDATEQDSSESTSDFANSNNEEEKKATDWKEKLDAAQKIIESGKVFNGLNQIKSLVEHHPENVDLRLAYGIHLLEDAKNIDDARSEFKKVILNDEKNIIAYQKLAKIEEENGDELLAKNYLEKALSFDGNNAETLYSLGVLVNSKFPELQDQAVKFLKKSIKNNENNPDAFYRYGLILDEHLKKPKKAIRQFEKTLELAPKHPFVNYDLALLYYRKGDFQTAANYYQKACEINFEFKTETNDRAFLGALEKIKKNASTSSEDIFKELDDDFIKSTLEYGEENPIEFSERISPRTPNFETVVLISGATSGIGKATAELFAKNGFRVILTGRRTDRLKELKNEFEKKFPTEIQTLKFDVRKIDQAQSAIASLPEEWNSIDILINNAGLAKGFDPIHEGKLEDWETMIDTNVKGLLFLTRLVSPSMVARKKGHIINVCSTAGHEVYPNGNVYCATKHAVDALTKGMRLDLYKHGLRVSQVSPAHVEETEFARVRFDWDTERAKIYEDFQPLKSEDVARTIYFIATQPDHVNIQDVLMMGKQQANSSNIDRSGR